MTRSAKHTVEYLQTVAITFFTAVVAFLGSPGSRAEDAPGLPKTLSSELPYDVDAAKVQELVKSGAILEAHRLFDLVAWQAFIALNWPANAEGEPDAGRTIADASGPRVWDFWRPSDTIFLKDGARPKPWGEDTVSPHLRWKAAWRQHTTQSSNLEAFSGPLVDQNGKWVRYQIRINRPEFDYILSNELYSQDGQVKFSQREKENEVILPVNVGREKRGSIEIKLAWKELGNNDDPSRFYQADLLSDVSEPTKPGEPLPQRKIHAGLVGMHISMRTESSPEWIWSTFEHVDNVRANNMANGSMSHPNFTNPDLPQPVNVLPQPNAGQDEQGNLHIVTGVAETPSKWVESLTTTPVQVSRVEVPVVGNLNPLDGKTADLAREVNAQVQQRLREANSVFQYYELIDVQWPVHPNAPAVAGGNGSAPESITHKTPGDMIPVFLVNTTMETYFQKGPQQAGPLEQDDRLPPNSPSIDPTPIFATESCVGCHYSSGIAIGFKKDKDGKELLSPAGLPTAIFGENNHFGKTGNASFSWMLQLEPQAVPRQPSPRANLVPGTATPKLPGLQN